MVYAWLLILGLCLGSFVNALVWRLREQEQLLVTKPKGIGKQLRKLSITRGRSMCTHCGHALAPKDLVPVLSWLYLRGKCRYCHKPIVDTPLAELLLPLLFILSYSAWPFVPNGWDEVAIAVFVVWLLILTCFLALAIYDARWQLLPNKLVVPLTIMGAAMVALLAYDAADWYVLRDAVAAAVGYFGVFYVLYSVSKEQWIGGGDVKIAISLGLIAGSPLAATLALFIASCTGTIFALPMIIRRQKKAMIPFGPFLIAGTIAVFLWENEIMTWYFGSM
jgi:prepilin signal peptidase PulO-like enzyme (type II secretory pathway)